MYSEIKLSIAYISICKKKISFEDVNYKQNMELCWELPPKGFVKVNVYGIFGETPLANGNRSGLGVLVRDSDGQILAMVSGALQIVNKRVNEL